MRDAHKDTGYHVDYHGHYLPGIDDGAADLSTSLAMLEAIAAWGVRRVFATPHFHPGEQTVEEFSQARAEAYGRVVQAGDGRTLPLLQLGAEVALSHDLISLDLPALAYSGADGGCTGYLLLELPYGAYQPWMGETVWNITHHHQLTVVLAHLERFVAFMDIEALYELVCSPRCMAQLNVSTFSDKQRLRFARELTRRRVPLLLGTDTHNLTTRPPSLKALAKAHGAAADEVLAWACRCQYIITSERRSDV